MALLKPEKIDLKKVENHSYAERVIIDKILNLDKNKTKDWIIYYSYSFKPNDFYYSHKSDYEIDFTFLLPDIGIFLLEVKGGAISLIGGTYQSRDKDGRNHKINPIEQVKGNYYNYRALLKSKYDIDIKKYISDFMISFPDINTVKALNNTDKLNNDIIFKDTDLYDYFINESYKYKQKYKDVLKPSKEIIKRIDNIMSGEDFIFKLNENEKIEVTNEIIEKQINTKVNTYKQILYDNPRCVINGVAGSGKTAFAIDLFRYYDFDNKKVLLLVFNTLLCENINSVFGEKNCYCIYELIDEIYNKYNEPLDTKLDFKDKKKIWFEYINKIDFSILKDYYKAYDCIIIDEAQDFEGNEAILKLFDNLLKDGLVNGNWYLFYDENQKLFVYDEQNTIYDVLYSDKYRPVHIYLSESIRYSSEMKMIINDTYNNYLTDKTIDFEKLLEGCENAKYYKFEDGKSLFNEVVNIINDLNRNCDIKNKQITILRDKKNSDIYNQLKTRYGLALSVFNRSKQTLSTDTVRKFKGLDNDVIIYIHDGDYKDSFDEYVALSRAKYKFYCLDLNTFKEENFKYTKKNDEVSDKKYNCDRQKSLVEILNDYDIDSKVAKGIVNNANKIISDDKIKIININKKDLQAIVSGTKDYNVSIYRDQSRLCFKCECNYYIENKKPCKHIISVIKKLKEK